MKLHKPIKKNYHAILVKHYGKPQGFILLLDRAYCKVKEHEFARDCTCKT